MKVGIDIAGGDFAPNVTIQGAIEAQKELGSDDKIVLIGDENLAKTKIQAFGGDVTKFEFIHAPDVIAMDAHPVKALKEKPYSSISVGFHYLAKGEIDAFSSAGNSGAMMVGAMYSIKPITGVYRPCITSVLPKDDGGVGIILDVGVIADCKPDVLYQFGILGSLFAEFVYGIKNPKVALLNIGEEEEKGNLLTQATYKMMKDSTDFNFVGNVEGRDLFDASSDVIVCDGFTGNVVLKEAEAFYKMMAKRGLLDDYFSRFNYELYGGTPILGVNGNVLIGHGISSATAIKNMLLLSRDVAKAKLPERIKNAFQ
ncbi:MAG: phosphate acyltransferase PlsX [Flavobacteriales bacterium]|nr:phosphate acyltransferase PlsX [Flavobacteriales bacterium]